MPKILTDEHLADRSLMPLAIAAIEDAMHERVASRMVSPPRHTVSFGDLGSLVFTIGGTTGIEAKAGFRVYNTFEGDDDTQLIAIWSPRTGKLEGLVLSELLGPLRTGAIGGVAVKYLAARDARTIGVIGTGMQARMQLEAITAVRDIREISVFSRNQEKRAAFAKTMSERLGIAVLTAGSAQAAVEQADIVVCATDSTTPVIQAEWLKPGCHVNSLGQKTIKGSELGMDVASLATVIATDSLEQTLAYQAPFFLHGTRHEARMIDLAEVVTCSQPGRADDNAMTLFCSVGLAGTEVLVGSRILEKLRDRL